MKTSLMNETEIIRAISQGAAVYATVFGKLLKISHHPDPHMSGWRVWGVDVVTNEGVSLEFEDLNDPYIQE